MRKFAIVINRPSSSAFQLRRALGDDARVVRLLGTCSARSWNYNRVINWGCSNRALPSNTLNRPEAVALAADKVKFFAATARYPHVVPATTYEATAREWLRRVGAKVVCRTLTRAHSGRGIVVADNEAGLVSAPLYTLYVSKRAEYRAHVYDGKVIALQQKRKRSGDSPTFDPVVRTAATGWVYAVNNVDRSHLPGDWEGLVSSVVTSLGLNFGAVDFCITDGGYLYVFEINTAPGISSPTVTAAYVKAFRTSLEQGVLHGSYDS